MDDLSPVASLAAALATDLPALALVLGGTLVATALRSGTAELSALADHWRRPRFRAEFARAELAGQVLDMRTDGLVRARATRTGDRELDEATRAMAGARSLDALHAVHAHHRATREASDAAAVDVLATAAELAPVFGLFATLVSLGKLPAGGIAQTHYMAAIAMAVHATMLGLLAAHLVFAPLALWVERRAAREESEREALVQWLAAQLADSAPRYAAGGPA